MEGGVAALIESRDIDHRIGTMFTVYCHSSTTLPPLYITIPFGISFYVRVGLELVRQDDDCHYVYH